MGAGPETFAAQPDLQFAGTKRDVTGSLCGRSAEGADPLGVIFGTF